ncbi:hypothetical protein F9C07_8752 [Aspergillus flavus]|uniref:Uncharacterized protein n=1 Tax=Aspergillus flavus (strain ATCC 200026 / FGSC A1120 / IAM 13836 / NRRL 3357 / JCM 12722 / SRRC 167) TaxID=332952 RepID=A0A7U2QU19_ASPFN|nr:hypothetical protein F9C07_8752 [Aspergillus flavus]
MAKGNYGKTNGVDADRGGTHGYVVCDDLTISATVEDNGISAGPAYGNLKDGLKLNFQLKDRKEFRFDFKNGSEVWVTEHGHDHMLLRL